MTYILAVDDDPQVLDAVEHVLERAGYEVMTCGSGEKALECIRQKTPDLLVLDIVMPEINGLEICRRLRADPYYARLPIIFLTAKGRPGDIAEGLDLGGDDYLVKPFEVVELPARVRALLRRAPGGTLDSETSTLEIGGLIIHSIAPYAEVEGRRIELTPVEHKILRYLALNAGKPVTSDAILEHVLGYPRGTGDTGAVRIHIKHLRDKIELVPKSPQLIRTVYGQGYVILP